MPVTVEQLNRVTLTTLRGDVEIPWQARDLLLARLQLAATAGPIVQKIRAVGAMRPVELTEDEKALVVAELDFWRLSHDQIPVPLYELRNELYTDYASAAARDGGSS
jgi:hypothetical protein